MDLKLVKLLVFLSYLVSEFIDLSGELGHFDGYLIRRLSYHLVPADLSADVLGLLSEVKGLQSFLAVDAQLGDATNYCCLALSLQRLLQNSSEF